MGNHVHGGDVYRYQNVIDFSSNCNPFGAPEGVRAAIGQAAEDIHHYPDVECGQLRQDLSAKLEIDPAYIFFGNGAAEVIFALAQALKPKKALVQAPTFAEYGQALTAAGCQVSRYVTEEKDGFRLDERFAGAITDDTDVVFLCNPNNPTGTLNCRDLMMQVLKRCETAGAKLVVDECFLDFVEGPGEYTLLGELKEHPDLMILRAFTKLYAMAGVRLGYGLTADEKLVTQMEQVVQPWNVSSLAQAAGRAALREETYVENSLAAIRRERQWLIEQMEALGLVVYDSLANYVFFRGRPELWQQCLGEGILLRDCSNYPGLKKGYYRAAVRLRGDNEKLIAALKKALKTI